MTCRLCADTPFLMSHFICVGSSV
uniref:Uncharacterized protein n=1 Tax=Anguilla anguilla TaxID=7936 RepID=A0A0E9T3V7_ANGAN